MNKTIRNIVLGTALVGVLLTGCSKKYQKIIPHKNGQIVLTDRDSDGEWDIAEEQFYGSTPGHKWGKLYFKKGYSPGRPVNKEIEYVNPDFFDKY